MMARDPRGFALERERAEAEEEVLVDQMPISLPFTPFADQQWEMVYLPLEAGVHVFQADQAFGLISYGWDQAVSYGYPAGLNFRSASWMP